MSRYATLKYDVEAASTWAWVAVLDDRPEVEGCGETPQKAVDSLLYQIHKHGL